MHDRPCRVLVVDDDQALRENLAECLEDEGYAVDQARDGAEAMARLLRPDPPQVVVLDLMMPGVGGRELVAAIRNHPGLGELRLVVVTGRSAADLGALPGVDAVLEKPFGLGQLLVEVGRACGRR